MQEQSYKNVIKIIEWGFIIAPL